MCSGCEHCKNLAMGSKDNIAIIIDGIAEPYIQYGNTLWFGNKDFFVECESGELIRGKRYRAIITEIKNG